MFARNSGDSLRTQPPELTINLDRSAMDGLVRRPRQKPRRNGSLRVSAVGVHFSTIGTFTPVFFANSFASS